ncbi:hypothetical protein T09_2842 [Trichinella sp. T9]|nr:hypothetical protein T09_2842 [Trichinella sp. T9]
MVYSSLILLFELWLVHAAISRMRNNEDEAKSFSESLYNDEYNGPNARSNKVLFLWKANSVLVSSSQCVQMKISRSSFQQIQWEQ